LAKRCAYAIASDTSSTLPQHYLNTNIKDAVGVFKAGLTKANIITAAAFTQLNADCTFTNTFLAKFRSRSWPKGVPMLLLQTLPQHYLNTTSTLPQHYLNTTSTLPQHYLNTTSTPTLKTLLAFSRQV
jgi:hypothetical protein